MRKFFVSFAVLVFVLLTVSAVSAQQKLSGLPDGAHYVSPEEQQRLVMQIGGARSQGKQTISSMSAETTTNGVTTVQATNYSGWQVFGAISTTVTPVPSGYGFAINASYTNSETIPAFSTIMACKSLPGESGCQRAISFDFPVSPNWTLDIIPGLIPSYNDWAGKGNATLYLFGPNGVASTKAEFVVNKNQTYERAQRFLYNPKEEPNGDISFKSTFLGPAIYAVLKDKEGYNQYVVPTSAISIQPDGIIIHTTGNSELSSLQPGNYRLSMSVAGVSDTIDLNLMRIFARGMMVATPTIDTAPISLPVEAVEISKAATSTDSFTGAIVVGGLDGDQADKDKKEEKKTVQKVRKVTDQ